MDRDGRGGADRPKAPHPWDPTPKRESVVLRDRATPKVVIQSAITKRGREEEEEEPDPDPDEEERRKKRGREDADDEEVEVEATVKTAGDEEQHTGMRMDTPLDKDSTGFDGRAAAKSRRISAEGDRDREREWDGDRDNRRDSGRDRDRARDRPPHSGAATAENKERSEGAAVTNKVAVKSRNKRMFGGLLGHLQKAKKEEETISQSDTIKKRLEVQQAAEQKAAEMGQKIREQSRAEQQAARENAREERSKNLTRIREIRIKQQEALHALAMVRGPTQVALLSTYIRTKTKPYIFWLPKTEKKGINTVLNPAVEALHEHTIKTLAEELVVTQKRIETQRAEDVAAEAVRQAAFETRHQEAVARRAEYEARGADAAGAKATAGKEDVAEEEEEDEEEVEEEIVL